MSTSRERKIDLTTVLRRPPRLIGCKMAENSHGYLITWFCGNDCTEQRYNILILLQDWAHPM